MSELGRTPLHLAVFKKDYAMVSNLLKEGANPNMVDNRNHTPLTLALSLEFTGIAELILKFSDRLNF